MNNTRATQWHRPIAVITVLALTLVTMTDAGVDAQAPRSALSALAERRDAVMRRLPPPSEAALANADEKKASSIPGLDWPSRRTALHARDVVSCAADSPNPFSSLVAREDNPAARALEGFVLRDKRGRRTRPWRALSRTEREKRGVVMHRPLLVFLETPTERQDFNKPWFGPVRFDRPGFPTTKEKIAEQVFGKDFDHRDPASVAGFYLRESGGKLVIKGDASSVQTVLVPHITFDPAPMVEAILAQLDPIVDFTKRADEFGWVDPIFIMTPFSSALDVNDPSVMGSLTYLGLGPIVYDKAPAITDDAFPDGSYAALSTVAISMVGLWFGSNQDSGSPLFGLPEDQTRTDMVELYAHEYGHNIGLSHMFTGDYGLATGQLDPSAVFARTSRAALDRRYGSGFVTTVMNYSYGSGGSPNLVPRGSKHAAGLDPMNRSKLGWGNVVEVTLTEGDRHAGPRELATGEQRRIDLVEHLGHSTHDQQPQILKVNLPPQQVSLFPQTDAAGNPTGYWRPGTETRRMAWSGRTVGGSRMMETALRVPNDLHEPVLSFWTKYGAHAQPWFHVPGIEFGWVQISTDGGRNWTSLTGQTSSTYVDPYRQTLQWVGQDLGAPAFTGNSGQFSANGWILEKIPLPLAPGASFRLRFNFSGYSLIGQHPAQDHGWWIDDVHLGTRADPTRHLVSDFEVEDARRWEGLLTEFDQGAGFVVVEQTSPFPQTYFFELRGQNAHDEIAFQAQHPKELNGPRDVGIYSYEEGIVGYFDDHYAEFWAYPYFFTGSATNNRVPIERLRRADFCYPYCAEARQENFVDLAGALAAASDPNSGVTLDDVVFFLTSPFESFNLYIFGQGYAYPVVGRFPLPSPVTLLDAMPTYRPQDVTPSTPETPFPERSPLLWPYILGSSGGWPKTVAHGSLGFNDPTTTRVVGQPFLGRDAAFHPDRNATFNDQVDYRGSFVNEFVNWHGPITEAAFASLGQSERIKLIPTTDPVSETESIQHYRVEYCPQDASGACAAPDQAVQRPWVEQILYERLAPMVFLVNTGSCPPPPPNVFTLETKPAWDTYYSCLAGATDNAHQRTNQLLDVARNLGDNPLYSWLNSYGDQGTLSPSAWSDFYLDAWSRAKGPAPLPSYGFSLEVERITNGPTPKATLSLRRSASNQRGTTTP